MSASVASTPGTARCPFHAVSAAIGACERCGTFICAACAQASAAARLCPRCAERVGDGLSGRVILALGLACFAFAVVPGVAALVLARAESTRIERNEAPPDGQPWLTLSRRLVAVQWAGVAIYFASIAIG